MSAAQKKKKSVDSLSPAPDRRDIIVHDVSASLESEAGHIPTNNLDGYLSSHVMQDLSLALTMVLVPSCNEAVKDSLDSSITASVPEGCCVGSLASKLTEMSGGLPEQDGGVVADRYIPSTGKGSKPAVRAVEANFAGQSECTKENEGKCSPIGEHLRAITALPSSGGGDFMSQQKELNIGSTLPADAPQNISFVVKGIDKHSPVSSSYRAQHDTSIASSDEVVSPVISAVESNIRDLVYAVDAPRN
ncbi:hypothetical protein K439DRAFT_1624050 [Ramaria rubella]|nr:hypothetical protein K439DRAFT_1624050 [Ramaria rubella]